MTGLVTKNFFKLEYAFGGGFTTASLQGSARSSKTYSIMQWLIMRCWRFPNTTVSIVRSTLPAIKRSVYRDFMDIIVAWGMYEKKCLNKSELMYTFPNGSWIEFFSCENEQKLRGPKRQILYVNEANEISQLEWQQLQMRTTVFSIIDYNPSFTDEHWINQVNQEPKTCFWISTYKDNPFLEQRVIDEIESLQWKNPTLWQVYGLGQRARLEGVIFERVSLIKEIPFYVTKLWRGIDFGFVNDVTAIVTLGYHNECIYIDEECYETHMTTNDIIRRIKTLPEARTRKIWADNAEPREITEIRNAGLPVMPTAKGAQSVIFGLDFMQGLRQIYVTKRSVGVKKEFDNYTWQKDRQTGHFINTPIDMYNHAIDACRYICWMELMGHAYRDLPGHKSYNGYF